MLSGSVAFFHFLHLRLSLNFLRQPLDFDFPSAGTVAEGAPIIPISAQLKYNIEVVCEYIVKKIPVPIRDFTSEPRLIGKKNLTLCLCAFLPVLSAFHSLKFTQSLISPVGFCSIEFRIGKIYWYNEIQNPECFIFHLVCFSHQILWREQARLWSWWPERRCCRRKYPEGCA